MTERKKIQGLIERIESYYIPSNAAKETTENLLQDCKAALLQLDDKWEPIEGALKDGTYYLCSEETWVSRAGHPLGGFVYIARYIGDKWVTSTGFAQPTHYQPLPTPPARKK